MKTEARRIVFKRSHEKFWRLLRTDALYKTGGHSTTRNSTDITY